MDRIGPRHERPLLERLSRASSLPSSSPPFSPPPSPPQQLTIVARTEEIKRTIAAEKEQLAREQAERDYRMRCDDVAKKIQARGKSRGDLEA
jgi:hypothetical protein